MNETVKFNKAVT